MVTQYSAQLYLQQAILEDFLHQQMVLLHSNDYTKQDPLHIGLVEII